jgi:hypothetical protein
MNQKLSRRGAWLSSWVVVACVYQTAYAQTPVNADAQVLADFQKRIDAYMQLHKKAQKESPPLKETKDPAQIQASQDAMAAKIQAARKTAKPGEIFTPEIRQAIRRLMYPETKGADGAETKAALKDDAPKGVTLKVNTKYPEDAPLPTVPPNLLASLPKLPEDLEYRIIDKHLLLRDVHANLIIDFIPNAIQ